LGKEKFDESREWHERFIKKLMLKSGFVRIPVKTRREKSEPRKSNHLLKRKER